MHNVVPRKSERINPKMAESARSNNTADRLLHAARDVCLACPSLPKTDVLFAVGMPIEQAESVEMKKSLKHLIKAHVQANGYSSRKTDDESLEKRAVLIKTLCARHPIKHSSGKKAGIKITEAMKLAGFGEDKARSGGKHYQRVFRLVELHNKQAASQEDAASATPKPASIAVPNAADGEEENAHILSPMSQASDAFSGSGSSSSSSSGGGVTRSTRSTSSSMSPSVSVLPDDFQENEFVWPLPYPNDQPLKMYELDELIHLPNRVKPRTLQTFTTTKNVRNTTNAAHQERQRIAEGQDIRNSIYRASTVLWDSVAKSENTLKAFDTADKVANAFNRLSGIELISGHELQEAVANGNVGKDPPKRGRISSVAQDEFQALCDIVFSFSAIQQINTLERWPRSKLMSAVGEIINAKRTADGLEPLSEPHFFRRIELHNSRKQNLNNPDRRESIRVQWLTYQALKLNYERWEETLVELGFARYPYDGEETNGEHVVFHDGQQRRIINLDETSFSMDASSNEGLGGRRSKVPEAVAVDGEGEAAPKSSEKVTVICGMNFEYEAMPPYIQFPTKAKDPSRYKLQVKMMLSLRQMKGKFGYPVERYFDVGFGMNRKGGMNKEAFKKYVTEYVRDLYPDAKDVALSRVMLKMDSGPGRNNPEMLQELRANGFYIYASLPNGTEDTQECDQNFSYFKTVSYRNREKLYRARQAANPNDTSPLSAFDIGHIMFGGSVAISDGSSLELEPAFDLAWDEEHIKRACDKCGYVPATRAALTSKKVRHEVVLDGGDEDDSLQSSEEGASIGVDGEADPIGALYLALEEQNQHACSLLLAKGFSLADKLKLSLHKVGANQVVGRQRVLTEPNTRERQDALMQVSTAGQFFHVTNGGGPMNSNDALIAWARKKMYNDAAELQKKKDDLSQFGVLFRSALKILQDPQKPLDQWKKKWTVADLRIIIQWKQGPQPKPPLNDKVSSMLKKDLQSLYERKYHAAPEPAVDSTWTDEMEAELRRLQAGNIESFVDDTGLTRAMDRVEECLIVRIQNLPAIDRRKSVLAQGFASLPKQEQHELLDALKLLLDSDTANGGYNVVARGAVGLHDSDSENDNMEQRMLLDDSDDDDSI